ncbi:hypothetical protein AB6A40_002890 [Gnathostoma spinigerum]|uniref:Exocyst complex component Sec8 n=1 Tax=Gnathostoma spinigerum TaxID=75299 RepID=A0ABD6EFJ1_9BILA
MSLTSGDEKPRAAPRRKFSVDNSSGLLLGMIRSLKTSSSDDQKELDRRKLELGFAESSKEIDRLVREYEQDVGTCLNSFRNVSSRITSCRERVHNVRNSLLTCRTLLQCRRDELKRLWMENAQQKHISMALAQIDSIRNIEVDVDDKIAHSDYLSAANALKEADSLLNGPFSNIDGLTNLRTHVYNTSKKLLDRLIDDLTELLIVQPFEFQLLEVVGAVPEHVIVDSNECRMLMNKYAKSLPAKNLLDHTVLSQRISSCIRALAVYERLTSTLHRIRQISPSVLMKCIRSTEAIVIAASGGGEGADSHDLSQYFQLVLSQLQNSYEVHCLLGKELEQGCSEQIKETGKELSTDFWKMAQNAIEQLLSEFLGIQQSPPVVTAQKTTSISVEKPALFRFDATACATLTRPTKQLHTVICEPSPWNITILYPHLERFCCEREAELGIEICSLRKFLQSFILDVFIDCVKTKLSVVVEQALHGHDTWRVLMQFPQPKVLASCYKIFCSCQEIGKLIETMRAYSDRLSALWLLVIAAFTKSTGAVYENITRPLSEGDDGRERRKISAAWAVDEDISRLLKSLPNWLMVNSLESNPSTSWSTPPAFSPVNESDMEIRQRNERESEILIGNLGTAKRLAREELITDMEQIRSLACIHESLKWFCEKMCTLIEELPENARQSMQKCQVQLQSEGSENHTTSSGSIMESVQQKLNELNSMADTCLLILHLELRVHCFYHLLPLARIRPSLPHDELDSEVIDFGRDLTQFHQLLGSHLPAHKMKYLFDGLGHLCASIFIHSSQHMPKLTDSGKKRVCRNVFAIQQRLSQLTGRRESELDRARSFFELLNHDPDQLLALILERGAVFSHLEYTFLLSLAVRSHSTLSAQPGALEQRMLQLKNILAQMKKL